RVFHSFARLGDGLVLVVVRCLRSVLVVLSVLILLGMGSPRFRLKVRRQVGNGRAGDEDLQKKDNDISDNQVFDDRREVQAQPGKRVGVTAVAIVVPVFKSHDGGLSVSGTVA